MRTLLYLDPTQENTIRVYTILYSLYWYRVNINNAGKDYIRKHKKKGEESKGGSGRGIRANKKDSTCSWFDAYGFTLNFAFVGHNYFPVWCTPGWGRSLKL